MSDLDQCHEILDFWFDSGDFSGLDSPRRIARKLQEEHPEFGLTRQGAITVVRLWLECAREMDEID